MKGRKSENALRWIMTLVCATCVKVSPNATTQQRTKLAADGRTGQPLDQVEPRGVLGEPTAWLFGNEAWGLAGDILALADETVAVPIYGQAESLNLAAAAAVCLYASARAQRSNAGGGCHPAPATR